MSLYIPKMSDSPGFTIPGLADNFDKLNFVADNAGFHNSIYRGKNLGTNVTPEQWANIANGTFEDMYIGDHWTRNGMGYAIAAFNYYFNTGEPPLTTNHLTLVPLHSLYTHAMNNSNTTAGGYVGSLMYEEGLDQAKNMIHEAFDGHVVTHKRWLSNSMSSDAASSAAWFDSDVELMNEHMVCGSNVVARPAGAEGHRYNIGIEKSQLPLFRLRHDLIGIRVTWWLRDIASASYFAFVTSSGLASRATASHALGVRPAFSIS